MSWKHIHGHDQWIQRFQRIVANGRLAHSYLFVGPDGVGKKLFARELGKALLCESRPDRQAPLLACDQCDSCRMVDAGTHPDHIYVRRPEDKNEMSVELMRNLCREFSLKPSRGKGKVAILDDADDLNPESANCFLKTLEEPPPGSVFFLIGTSRDKQMPTILSRCQVIRFAPLPDDLLEDLTSKHGVNEQEARSRLVQLSGGSIGQAMRLADPELWRFRNQLLDLLAASPLDVVKAGKLWHSYVETAGKEMPLQRALCLRVIRLVVAFLREALALSAGGQIRTDDNQEITRLRQICSQYSQERLIELIDRCLDAEVQVERYLQLPLVIEALIDSFCERT